MKRTIVSAAVLTLLAGGASVAVADPGPNGNNTFGLCTAYSSGSDQGQSKKQENGKPFIALEAAADAEEMTVAEYCEAYGQQPGNGGGKRP